MLSPDIPPMTDILFWFALCFVGVWFGVYTLLYIAVMVSDLWRYRR